LLQRPRRIHRPIGLQIFGQPRRVREREFFNSRFQEKFEWIVRRKLCDEVYLNQEFVCLFQKEKARQSIIVGVQLPVQDVFGRSDVKGVAEDWRATVQRRAQLDNLRTEGYRLLIPVACPVI
jgi:hypothetical protein